MTMMARRNGSRASVSFLGKRLSYFALLAFTLFALYPISQIITIALRPSDQLLSTSLALIPQGATLANFRVLLAETPFLHWLGNSTLIAFAVTLTGIALASTCGYALSVFWSQRDAEWFARHPNVSRNDVVAAALLDPDQVAPDQFLPQCDRHLHRNGVALLLKVRSLPRE